MLLLKMVPKKLWGGGGALAPLLPIELLFHCATAPVRILEGCPMSSGEALYGGCQQRWWKTGTSKLRQNFFCLDSLSISSCSRVTICQNKKFLSIDFLAVWLANTTIFGAVGVLFGRKALG